jgi:hypothetical protein
MLDEDDMASNSATQLASQQSIRAYVDTLGGAVLLNTIAIGISTATIDIESVITPTYHTYLVTISQMQPATDGARLIMRTSTDNGTTYNNGASDYGWSQVTNGTAANDTTDTAMRLTENTGSGNQTEGLRGSIWIYNPTLASDRTSVVATLLSKNSTGGIEAVHSVGERNVAEDNDAIRFLFNIGNVARMIARVYGFKA